MKNEGMAEEASQQDAEETPSDNASLWNAWPVPTPKEALKQVSYGRKFTAIDAYYKLAVANDVLGPLGIGWGYRDPVYTIVNVDGADENGAVVLNALLHLRATFWYRWNSYTPTIDIENAMFLVNKAGRVDDEAYKKLLTDTMTKFLSYLGSCNDIFCSAFSSNRYVEPERKERPERSDNKQPEAEHKQPDVEQPPEEAQGRAVRLYQEACQAWAKAGATEAEVKAWIAKQSPEYTSAAKVPHDVWRKLTLRANAMPDAVARLQEAYIEVWGDEDGDVMANEWLDETYDQGLIYAKPEDILAAAAQMKKGDTS